MMCGSYSKSGYRKRRKDDDSSYNGGDDNGDVDMNVHTEGHNDN